MNYPERSCRCPACRQTCHEKPGFLVPGDLERITEHVGMSGDRKFVYEHFRAVIGPDVVYGDDPTAIPVIRPAMPEGHCVFLTDDDRCGIYPVRPYGCSRINNCREHDAEEQAGLDACARDLDYLETWTEIAYEWHPVT